MWFADILFHSIGFFFILLIVSYDVQNPFSFMLLFFFFTHSVVSDSLQSQGLQHAKLPCRSSSPEACSNSCLLRQWSHPTISSSAVPFSSRLQSFQHQGFLLMNQLFSSGSQSVGASASASVLPMNIQGWFLLGFTGMISLQSNGLSRVFSRTTIWKHQFFCSKPTLWYNSHICIQDYWENYNFTIRTFVQKVISLLFNMLCRFVIAFSEGASVFFFFNFMGVVTIHCDSRAQENKVCHYFHFFPNYLPWGDGTRCHDLSFLNVEF